MDKNKTKNNGNADSGLSTLDKEILLRINLFDKKKFKKLKQTFREQAGIIVDNIYDYNELKKESLQKEDGMLNKSKFINILRKTLQEVN